MASSSTTTNNNNNNEEEEEEHALYKLLNILPNATEKEIKKAKEGLKYPALTYPKAQDIKNVEVIKIKVNNGKLNNTN